MKSYVRRYWTPVFLGATGIVIGLELLASIFGDDGLLPWTHYITEHIQEEHTFFLIGGLAMWLFKHFEKVYREKRERQ